MGGLVYIVLYLLFAILSCSGHHEFLSSVQRPSKQAADGLSNSIDLRYPPPSVRYAPRGYKGHNFGAWKPPSPEKFEGVLYITHDSDKSMEHAVNWTTHNSATDAGGGEADGNINVDIEWQRCSNDKPHKCNDMEVYGTAAPMGAMGPTDTKYGATWNFTASVGPDEASQRWEGLLLAILAYGKDDDGLDWLVLFRADGNEKVAWGDASRGGKLSFMTKNDRGFEEGFAQTLRTRLVELARELEDSGFVEMAEDISKTERE